MSARAGPRSSPSGCRSKNNNVSMIDSAKWIEVDGIKTRYVDVSRGSPIVLVHGGAFGDLNAAPSLDDWALNIDGLARSHRVIGFDRLGQGFTDNPKREQDWSMRG